MSETKHSPEPWRTLEEFGTPWAFEAADGTHVGQVDQVASVHVSPKQVLRTANVRRLVACVNACAGVPTEALEAGALARALEAATLFYRIVSGEQTLMRNNATREAADALRALGRLP